MRNKKIRFSNMIFVQWSAILVLTFLYTNVSAQVVDHVSLGDLQAGLENHQGQVESEMEANRARVDRNRGAIDSGIDILNQGMGAMDTLRDFGESFFNPLVPEDTDFDPDFNPPGAPQIPVHCQVEGGASCEQCYGSAYRKLNFVRHYLEVLRGIYGATKNYTDNAIAFGDSMSGLHGGFGLAWPPERKGIQDSMGKMNKTYDKKYADYMRELLKALQAVAQCEKQFFNQDDWYNRYGFIYYTYMQDRYKR